MRPSSNATVLGVAPLSRVLPAAAAVLVALFVLIRPEATQGYNLPERVVFWTLHIGLGLASVWLASRLIATRFARTGSLIVAVIVTGLFGAALLAPLYLAIEQLIPTRLQEAPDDWLDAFAARGVWQAVVAEFVEVTPVFLAAWAAVNLPLLLERSDAGNGTGPEDEPPSKGLPEDGTDAKPTAPPVADEGGFLARVPRALGTEIIVVSSDLHYLHVHTTEGKCMILGTLREVSERLGEAGMQVHRSHWVARAHVRRLVRRGNGLECDMSNDLRIPISRRNRARATEWFGRAGNVVSMSRHQAG